MDIAGKYVMEKRENYEEFAAASGGTPEQIEKGKNATLTTEVCKDGDSYTVKRIYPNQTVSNTFKLGVASEFTFVEGKKAQATVTMEEGKMVLKGANFSQISEIVDGKLKETLTLKDKTMIRWSTKA